MTDVLAAKDDDGGDGADNSRLLASSNALGLSREGDALGPLALRDGGDLDSVVNRDGDELAVAIGDGLSDLRGVGGASPSSRVTVGGVPLDEPAGKVTGEDLHATKSIGDQRWKKQSSETLLEAWSKARVVMFLLWP